MKNLPIKTASIIFATITIAIIASVNFAYV